MQQSITPANARSLGDIAMRFAIAFGCLLGFVALCILALVHVIHELWLHRADATPDTLGRVQPRQL
jgi:hypothetical protein